MSGEKTLNMNHPKFKSLERFMLWICPYPRPLPQLGEGRKTLPQFQVYIPLGVGGISG
jgi:hypothetical protein